jgi:hypothetical protein
MAWGARQEDGIWRLCERRGRTIIFACKRILPDVQIRFPGRSQAEECAKVLNELHWEEYERFRKNRKRATDDMPFAWIMLKTIHEFKGISDKDIKRLEVARDKAES